MTTNTVDNPVVTNGVVTNGVITFDRTIPQALVDRGDPTTVLLTSWIRDGNRLTAGACWPRLGGFYSLLDPDRHDAMLVLETGRQCALLAAHVVADIPLATMQIMQWLTVETMPATLPVAARPTEVVTHVECQRVASAGSAILQMDLSATMHRDDVLIGRMTGRAVVPSERMYLRVRGRDPQDVGAPTLPLPAPVAPRSAGRMLSRDVVIAPDPQDRAGTYLLRIDVTHPNFFDNPTDHTPGMLLIEAMRQAIVAESGNPVSQPAALAVRFHTFVELDSPADVVVTRTDDGYQAEVCQFGVRTTEATWTVDG